MQERRRNFISAVAFVLVKAVGRTLLQTLNERKAMTVNHFRQRLFPATRLCGSIVARSCAGIIAAGVMALISWVALALLGY